MSESTIIRLDLYRDNCPVPCYICGQKIRPDEEGTRAFAQDHIALVCLECIESGTDAIKARLVQRAEEGERRAKALRHDPHFADEVWDLTASAAADRALAGVEWVLPT
jgi:ribosome-binding protein aMBF1 (putative translation factor)